MRSAAEQERTSALLGDVRFLRSYAGSPFTLGRVDGSPPILDPFVPLSSEITGLAGERPIDLPLARMLHLVRR